MILLCFQFKEKAYKKKLHIRKKLRRQERKERS
jgi:hypothetical protein